MNGGHGASFGIDEENGNAICGLDAEEQAGTIRGGGVAAAWFGGRGVEEMDDVGMELFECDEAEIFRAEGGLEVAAVFEDVFASVPVREAEI
jgi:hypothetical protein